MSYKTTLNNLITSRGGGSSSSSTTNTTTKVYGRVVDIILDEDHSEYINQGGGLAINGVFYKPLNKNYEEESPSILPFAYQNSSNIKVVPVVGEIVEVETVSTPSPLGNDNKTRKFYTKIVNVWNNPNSGLFLDIINNPELDISSKDSFIELAKVNPIKSGPGDIQFEGRQGQSIRFAGSKVKGVDYIDNSNNGKPVIIISNGQSETEQGFTTLSENINEDASSIYMVSDHQIPLKQASLKRSAWNDKPTQANEFKGNQVIINGGRLFFNAKEHDIQLSSIKSIGLNTEGTINIDSTSYMCFDGSQIYLGAKSRTAPDSLREPVVLGNQLEGFLKSVLNILEGMARDMATAKTVDKKPIPKLNKRGLQARPIIKALKRRINPSGPSTLKSKKVFTE
jgi:hypothetical protein